jgi:NTE family protein
MIRFDKKALKRAADAFWSRLLSDEVPGVGLALGGGFARGIAHVGVLRVLERERIPIKCIAGVSSGSIIAAGFAGGADSYALEKVARAMKFADVAGWRLSRLGLVGSERMEAFLRKAIPVHRFEQMRIPLAIVATDLKDGTAVVFRDEGEVFAPVRASCSYPGLFQPVRHAGRFLVDGAISMDIPARPLRAMGAGKVVSVALPPPPVATDPGSMFAVVNRCFQIMQKRTENDWRQYSDFVIAPDVCSVGWDDFTQVDRLIDAGMQAAERVLPMLRRYVQPVGQASACANLQTRQA